MSESKQFVIEGGKDSKETIRPVLPSGIKGLIFKVRIYFFPMKNKMDLLRPYFHYMGRNVKLFSPILPSESYLISIEDNVICAAGVRFITHDASVSNNLRMSPDSQIDKVGPIVLHENCFIGAYTILMPNCSVGKNSIVAAGSVVSKHIPDNEVWGGAPAKFITTVDKLIAKRIEESKDLPWFIDGKKLSGNELVVSREKYYFKD